MMAEAMKLEVLKNEKNELEFVMKGNRHTYPGLLRERLLADKTVVFAAYKLIHPLESSARMIVRTEGKTAKQALLDAVKEIDAELDDFEKKIKKTLK